MAKKVLNIFEKICISLALLMFVLVFIVGVEARVLKPEILVISFAFLFLVLFVVGGFILTWIEAKHASLIGHCFLASGLTFNFLYWFVSYMSTDDTTYSMAFVFSLIAFILYIASLVLYVVARAISSDENLDDLDVRVEKYKEYKKLFEEGYISQEELDAKKAQLLNVKPVKKVASK